MNKVQKMVMSFAAVAMIVGFSAFKFDAKPSNNARLTTYYYGWNEIDNEYQRITTSTPDLLECESVSDKVCAIHVDLDTSTPPAALSEQEASNEGAQPYNNSSDGSYFNP